MFTAAKGETTKFALKTKNMHNFHIKMRNLLVFIVELMDVKTLNKTKEAPHDILPQILTK